MRIKIFLLCVLILTSFITTGCFKEEFGGIGIQVPFGTSKVNSENQFVIVSVFKGGTAEAAGIKKDDIIVKIDGENINGKQQNYIVKNMLRGKVGTIVTLEIKRGKDLIVFRVPRGRILLQE